MKNRSVLFSISISFFVAFIFLILVSLELHNQGIQSKEMQLEEQIQVMKQLDSKESIQKYIKGIPKENEKFLILLENKNVIYTNTFHKTTEEVKDYVLNNEKLLKENSVKDLMRLENVESNFLQTQKLRDGLFFIGTYKTDSMLKVTSHFLPYFIVAGFIGSLLMYILYSYILKKYQDETRFLIRSFKKYVRDPEFKMDYSPYIEFFGPDMQREAKDVRRRIESLESRLNGLNDMIVNMMEGVILVGEDRKIISINEAAVKLVDASIHINYQGKDLLYLCREMNFYKAFSKAFDQSVDAIKKIQFGDKIVKIYFNPVFTVEKEFFGMMLLLIDETAATIAERQRREFTSNVTHELKTPLTSIRGYTELLKSGTVKEEDENKFLDIILAESQRLFELIDAIISMSRLEEKNRIEEYEIVDIFKLIDELISAHKSEIDAKTIKVKINPALDNRLFTHFTIMKEVLWNLINNAVVYNVENGSITINIKSSLEELIVEIEDTGIGISYEEQNRIFERFYMVDKSRSYNKKSTGLGLAIVKHNVENLQGVVEMKSQLKEGTKFILKFPKKEFRKSQ